MRSFVIVIRSVYFGAKKRRKYAKSVGVKRSGTPRPSYKNVFLWHKWKRSVYLVCVFISI